MYRLITTLIALAGSLVLACAPAAPPAAPTAATGQPAKPPPAATAAQAVPTAGAALKQELIVGVGADDYSTDPARGGVGMWPVGAQIFENLTRLDEELRVQPQLAERWEHRGGTTWRFFLRKGVAFHDGQPLNAHTAKPTFDRVTNMPGGGSIPLGENAATIVDDYTLDITAGAGNVRLPEEIVHPIYGVFAPGSHTGSAPVGTGPFKFVEYVKGQRLVAERNPAYWGPRTPLDKVTFRFYPDGNTRALALRAGEVHMIGEVPREMVRDLGAAGMTVIKTPVGAYQMMAFNRTGEHPWDLGQDPDVRRAVAMAVDRRAIVDSAWQGNAEPAAIPINLLGPQAGSLKAIAYDPVAARKRLADAGWRPGPDGIRERGGRRLRLTIIAGHPNADAHRPVPEVLQIQLKQVGIDLAIVEVPDTAAYEARVRARDGDLWIEFLNARAVPCGYCTYFTVQPGGSPLYGPLIGFRSEKFDQTYRGVRAAPSLDEAYGQAAEAGRILYEEEATQIVIAGLPRIWAMRAGVEGFKPHPIGFYQYISDLRITQ